MKTFGELKGLQVMSGAGRVIGKVSDLEIDPSTWRVTGLLIKLDKDVSAELGQKRRASQLVIQVEHVKAVSDMVLLRESIHELAAQLEGHAAAPH